MADLCCAYTIAGQTLNPSSGDGLYVGENGIVGLDGRPIRAEVDEKGRADGGIVHIPKYFGPRAVGFSGIVGIKSVAVSPNSAYFAAVNAVENAWVAALEGILNTPSTLAWTEHGGSPQSLTVTYGIQGGEIQFAGSMMQKTFRFVLIAETG